MVTSYYSVETCANAEGEIYYQRVQQVEDGVAETIAYWNAGRKVPAATEVGHRQFSSIAEVMAEKGRPGDKRLLHPIVAEILQKPEDNSLSTSGIRYRRRG